MAKYSASSSVETVIGPTSLSSAIFATSILFGVLTCGLKLVFNSTHFFLTKLQFFSKRVFAIKVPSPNPYFKICNYLIVS